MQRSKDYSEKVSEMTELEKYIMENAGAFDEQDLQAGHLERFESKLEAILAEQEQERRSQVSPISDQRVSTAPMRPVIWRRVALGIAAAAAILLAVGIQSGKLWMVGAGNDPAEVYRAYSGRTAAIYGKVLAKDYDGSKENALRGIAEEAVPLIDQLPDELGDAAKAAILREYYGELLEGARRVSRSQ